MGDYDGRYFPYGEGRWVPLLQKYSKTKLLSRCPADIDPPKKIADYWKNVYTDYWSGMVDIAPPLESAIVYKRTTVFFMDGPPVENVDEEGHHTWWGLPRDWVDYSKTRNAEKRHGEGFLVLFCDWHVKRHVRDDFKTSRVNTTAGNPLFGPEFTGMSPSLPRSPWDNRNDGTHPWFRGD